MRGARVIIPNTEKSSTEQEDIRKNPAAGKERDVHKKKGCDREADTADADVRGPGCAGGFRTRLFPFEFDVLACG